MFPAWLLPQKTHRKKTITRRAQDDTSKLTIIENETKALYTVTHKHQIAVALLLALPLGAAFTSCADDDFTGGNKQPIAFALETAEQQTMTRATTTLGRDFYVYGYKNVSSSYKLVFNGYNVYYKENSANSTEDNTYDYFYVKGDQTIKFWDYSAANYRYWGYVKTPASTYDPATHTLTYSNCSASSLADGLYSRTKTVVKENFGKVVQMQFVCPATKVKVCFYTDRVLTSTDHINLTDIVFAPIDGLPQIVNKGTYTVTYNTANPTEDVTVTPASDGVLAALNYQDVTLTSANCTSDAAAVALNALTGQAITPLFPHNLTATPTAFKLTLKMEGEERTAEVPDNYMHWLPNYSYTYLFKISDAGTRFEFIDVIIDPWTYGGVVEDEWHTW